MVRNAVVAGVVAAILVVGGRLWADQTPSDTTSRWPMHAQTADGADVTIFQPQMEDFQGDNLSARAAVSVVVGGQPPIFGAIWLQSRVSTDRVARTVHILDVQVTRDRFPDASSVSEPQLAAAVRQVILSQDITLSLDQLLEMLATVQKAQTAAADLQSPSPTILFRDHPAVKVQYDGTPRLEQDPTSHVFRAVNTPFFVAMDPAIGRTYYLKGAGQWFAAADPMGPFQLVANAPPSLTALADSSGYQDPEKNISDQQAPSIEIVTASTPTELIWSDGQPQLSTVPGTGLLYWANTTSDVFVHIDTQQTFALLSGRWYAAANVNGPWTFVAPDKLPADFSRIPPDSDKADVLANVPGTEQAQEAVADTELPQTAAVDVNNFEQPPVEYDGDPHFAPVENSGCSYADNTDAAVLLVGGNYYCCYNAVWYLSPHPHGPWGICRRVPHEIYGLPPSCPLYPVRFVAVYGFTPDVVYVGYTPGYIGCFAYDGVVVYGTGYYYNPWVGRRYFARPATFGFAARYDGYTGHWGFDFAVAGGGGGLWIGDSQQHPADRHRGYFGFGGYRPSLVRDDSHIDPHIIARNNEYIRSREAQFGQHDAFVRNVYDRRKDIHQELSPQARQEINRGRSGPAPVALPQVVRHEDTQNDVFTDHNGNVYRRTNQGWEMRGKSDWKPEQPDQSRRGTPESEPKSSPDSSHQAPPEVKANPDTDNHANPPPPSEDHGAADNRNQGTSDNSDRDRDLDRDYRARQAGENRRQEYQPRSGGDNRSDGRSNDGANNNSGGRAQQNGR